MRASVAKKDWLASEGHIYSLNSNSGLSKLREFKSDGSWFVIQDTNLFCYDQKRDEIPPHTKPVQTMNISECQLEVYIILSSGDGKEYQLTPPKDIPLFDWLINLKETVKFASNNTPSTSTLERRTAGPGSIMGKLRHSFRRKKKIGRTLSEEPRGTGRSSPNKQLLDMGASNQSSKEREVKVDRPRSKSFPWELPSDSQTLQLSDTLPPLSELGKSPPTEPESVRCSLDDKPGEECQDTSEEEKLLEDNKDTEEDEKMTNMTVSTEAQTDDITNGEMLSLQQQKITKELEIEVCKLKCEVISLIQGSIKIPLKDDDLADWQLVEDIRYKDRIYELLREARLHNPSLPDFDSSASCSFKDSHGFIRGTRESESEVFHYVCRELKQYYSSFYQNKKGHTRLWSQYVTAKQQDAKNIFFKEKEMKALLREGIPAAIRREVWQSAMSQKVDHIRKEKGKDYYHRLLSQVANRHNISSTRLDTFENQIKCDLLRTMPNNERFRNADSDGTEKLWRILRVFCLHRPDFNYLQGMNFIVAMCLLFMDEEDSFWSLVAVSEVYMKNYFDESLSGAQADQLVLNDLLSEMLPALHAHLKYYGVDMSTVTFNWLLTIFIDAVPFETAVRVWDCFVFEGREALFRVAMGLLKLQQRTLLQLSCPLDIMQYMKRAARVTYDKDQLLKCSYDELKGFPSAAFLDEKQAEYLAELKTRNDTRLRVRDERKRSRVSSFIVEVPNQEKLDKPDQHEILECALATSKDMSTPVCLFCSSRFTAKVYLLDIGNKELKTMDVDLKSRVLCADMLEDGTILVGTVSWYMHAFRLDLSEEVWCIQLSDSVIDIAHLPGGKLFAALADGSIAVLQNASGEEALSEGSHIRVGGAPVTCLTLVEGHVWCGCGNSVVVLDGNSHVELGSLVVSKSRRHQVSKLTHGKHGVWCTVRGSPSVILLGSVTFNMLLKVDDVRSLDTTIVPKVIAFHESRVTTVMSVGQELWVGLGNGQVLIFDVINNDAYENEAYVVLSEQEEGEEVEKTCADRGKTETIAEELKTEGDSTQTSDESYLLNTPQQDESTSTGESSDDKLTVGDTNIPEVSAATSSFGNDEAECNGHGGEADPKQSSMDQKKTTRNEGQENSCVYHNDYKFRLRLTAHYRINEEAIRCLLLLREEDPVVLSCAGSFSEEGALSLWQRQKEEDTNEWLPLPVKHRFTETGPVGFKNAFYPYNS